MAREPIKNSIKLLIAVGGLATSPGLLEMLGAGVSVSETTQKLFEKTPPKISAILQELTESAQKTFDSVPDLPADAAILFEQMIRFSLPSKQDIIEAQMQAGAICDAMLNRLEKQSQPEYTSEPMRRLFRNITEPVFKRLLDDKSFTDELMPAWMQFISATLTSITIDLADNRALQKTIAELKAELGTTDTLLRGFFKTILQRDVPKEEYSDALFQIASEWTLAGERISEFDEFSDVSPRLKQLKSQVKAAYEAEDTELVWTLLTRIEDEQSAYLRNQEEQIQRSGESLLKTKSAKLAIAASRLDVGASVTLIFEILELAGSTFEGLITVAHEWYSRGRDKGLRFDLEVAIKLAEECTERASSSDQRGTAWNELGKTLQVLGSMDGDTARLEKAAKAFIQSGKNWTRKRVPLDWAQAQNNLGVALTEWGKREDGIERLREAVDAFGLALEVRLKVGTRYDCAATNQNLGNAAQIMGERLRDPNLHHFAIAGFNYAIGVWSPESEPQDWAMAQDNLGIALTSLANIGNNPVWLKKAIKAHRSALAVFRPDMFPQDWAKAMNNLGNALNLLGRSEKSSKRMGQAIQAYECCKKVRTRDRIPMAWANTQCNLCSIEISMFEITRDDAYLGKVARLDHAQIYLDQAREVFAEAQASQYLKKMEQLQAQIDTFRGAVG